MTDLEPRLDALCRILTPRLPEPVPIDKLDLPARTVTGLTRDGYRDSQELFDDLGILIKKGNQIGKVGMAKIRTALKQLGYPID